jgi:hypothetical protein
MELTVAQLVTALSAVPDIEIGVSGTGVCVYVPAIHRSILIEVKAVVHHKQVTAPGGARAQQFVLEIGGEPVQAIVAADDLVFAPDTHDSGFGIKIVVRDAPPLVSFREMMRDLDNLERRLDRSDALTRSSLVS